MSRTWFEFEVEKEICRKRLGQRFLNRGHKGEQLMLNDHFRAEELV